MAQLTLAKATTTLPPESTAFVCRYTQLIGNHIPSVLAPAKQLADRVASPQAIPLASGPTNQTVPATAPRRDPPMPLPLGSPLFSSSQELLFQSPRLVFQSPALVAMDTSSEDGRHLSLGQPLGRPGGDGQGGDA